KSLGQNFLIDQNLIRRLVDESGVGAGSLVLEVGPGTGTMTEELLDRGCRVVASELDRGLCGLLRSRHADDTRFRLVEGDCLSGKSSLSAAVVDALAGEAFTLVSNLPYGAGTGVLLALLTRHPECRRMAVTVQREVADRLCAEAGTEAYGSISVVAQCVAHVRRVATLPPECFWPRPEVTSAMVVLDRRAEPLTDDAVGVAEFCKRGFAARRKQLRGVLRSMGWGGDASALSGLAPNARLEELSPEQIASLERAGRAR
ncbi:MAG: ribosomal RNA small subunit methyltransferase A, partial [Phycisphaerales bacterium]|nr:ribosomal RNA small subunit methyltransferase A [Phycisphaerales bacterium]